MLGGICDSMARRLIHGGYNVEHGGTTMQERYTFIAANKDLTGYISSSPIC